MRPALFLIDVVEYSCYNGYRDYKKCQIESSCHTSYYAVTSTVTVTVIIAGMMKKFTYCTVNYWTVVTTVIPFSYKTTSNESRTESIDYCNTVKSG